MIQKGGFARAACFVLRPDVFSKEDTMPVTRHGDFAPPPPQDDPLIRAMLDALTFLELPARRGMARFLTIWADAAPSAALLLKTLLPDLTDDVVAAAVGIHRSTLFRMASYRTLKAILAEPATIRIPRGEVERDGSVIEAWLEEAG